MSPEVPHHPAVNALVCQGPTLDILLLRDLFHSLIECSRLFQLDPHFREEVHQALQRLPTLHIGQVGQIQEWNKDWDNNADLHNRHLYVFSFLFSKRERWVFRLALICIVSIPVSQ